MGELCLYMAMGWWGEGGEGGGVSCTLCKRRTHPIKPRCKAAHPRMCAHVLEC